MALTDISRLFPACGIELPKEYGRSARKASFYLAMEEYVAQVLPEDNYFFTWQVDPTVVFGRNQVIEEEVNLAFCHAEQIDVVRRKSGGGCIFADRNNIMTSLIVGPGRVEPLFATYASAVAGALQKLGAEVEVSGRNDIILRDHGKICGNAFYHLPHRNIIHGTMLYDTDTRLMSGALRPDMEKLKSAGVKSVRSRVAFLKDVLSISVIQLRDALCEQLTNRIFRLTETDIERIENIEATYRHPDFLIGRTSNGGLTRSARVENCGRVTFHFVLKHERISSLHLSGDFFESDNAFQAFNEAFIGRRFTPEDIRLSLQTFHPERHIVGLTETDVLSIIFPTSGKNPARLSKQ